MIHGDPNPFPPFPWFKLAGVMIDAGLMLLAGVFFAKALQVAPFRGVQFAFGVVLLRFALAGWGSK